MELLVYGNIDDIGMGIVINQPLTFLASPVLAFTSPSNSVPVLGKVFRLVNGIHPKFDGHIGQHSFEIFHFSPPNMYNISTVVVSTGWPDLSGAYPHSLPYITNTDLCNALQTSVVLQIADCVVIVVERLTRSEFLFLTKFLSYRKWVVIWHNIASIEEYKVFSANV
jgi:hypothetical protein